MVKIVKKSGKFQNFSKAKIARGCIKSGASKKVANEAAEAVLKKAVDGMSTRWIGALTIVELRKRDKKAGNNFKKYFDRNWK